MGDVGGIPAEIAGYVSEIEARVTGALGGDLLGMWLLGSAAQGSYDHGISDIDILVMSRNRWPAQERRALGEQLVHPALPCPTAGLELVWYARPDLLKLADPVQFQLNVNGGLSRGSAVMMAPHDGPNYWSVLDLAAVRQVGLPLAGSEEATWVVPPVPRARVRDAVSESLRWHDDADSGSPNRLLNLARLLLLVEQNRWVSKAEGAAWLRTRMAEMAPAVDEALAARAEKRWMDPVLAEPLSAVLRDKLG